MPKTNVRITSPLVPAGIYHRGKSAKATRGLALDRGPESVKTALLNFPLLLSFNDYRIGDVIMKAAFLLSKRNHHKRKTESKAD